VAKKANAEPEELSELEKIARLLALIAVKDLPNEEAARRLLFAGFDSPQIGGLLGVGQNFANTAKFKGKAKSKS
jgi:hypothetical protein